MNRMFNARVAVAIALMAGVTHGVDYGDPGLARIQRRYERARWGRQAMSPVELQAWSAARRRARQTHPGKRGKA